MNKAYRLLILLAQVALTSILLISIYMVFAFMDSDFGFDGIFGLLIFQPITAIVISGLTISICLLVGLPIRTNEKINNWWISNFYISIAGLFCAAIVFFIATRPSFSEIVFYEKDGEEATKQIPNTILLSIGWFMTAFFTLHLYPPRNLLRKTS